MHGKNDHEFDVVVVGGGPGGSTVSTLVAMQGHRVLLLEKEEFPRYQIGESLLPATVHGICRLLGVTDELEKAAFMPKRGGTFRWGTNPEPWTFSFSVSRDLLGPDLAGLPGRADEVRPDPPGQRARQGRRGAREELRGGRHRGGRPGLRRASTATPTASSTRCAAASWWTPPATRAGFTAESAVPGTTRTSSATWRCSGTSRAASGCPRRTPATSSAPPSTPAGSGTSRSPTELTSVGAVVRREALRARAGRSARRPCTGLIERVPAHRGLPVRGHAGWTSGPYGEIRVRKDYSYCQDQFWRPGMVLVGDAACFIDPVFSSGVHLATYSGLLAARSINSSLNGDFEEIKCFEEFEARYRNEYARLPRVPGGVLRHAPGRGLVLLDRQEGHEQLGIWTRVFCRTGRRWSFARRWIDQRSFLHRTARVQLPGVLRAGRPAGRRERNGSRFVRLDACPVRTRRGCQDPGPCRDGKGRRRRRSDAGRRVLCRPPTECTGRTSATDLSDVRPERAAPRVPGGRSGRWRRPGEAAAAGRRSEADGGNGDTNDGCGRHGPDRHVDRLGCQPAWRNSASARQG